MRERPVSERQMKELVELRGLIVSEKFAELKASGLVEL